MLLFILGIIDLVASILVFLSLIHFQAAAMVIFIISGVLIIKGLMSLASLAMFPMITDFAGAAILLLTTQLIFIHYVIVAIIGLLLLVKSLQSIAFSIL